jgi:hypothetical protein
VRTHRFGRKLMFDGDCRWKLVRTAPHDKRSDDKAASAASGLGRAMKIRPPQLATWSVPSTNPPEEKNERGRDPAE